MEIKDSQRLYGSLCLSANLYDELRGTLGMLEGVNLRQEPDEIETDVVEIIDHLEIIVKHYQDTIDSQWQEKYVLSKMFNQT